MKKIITTIAIALITNTAINAQVTKPKVNVNRGQVNSTPMVQGLEVRNLDKMTPAEFKKLKIPVAQFTREKLNAKPTRTWRITPRKLSDGWLKLHSIYGITTPTDWQIINSYDHFPLKVKFRLEAGIYYRLKLKPNPEGDEDARLYICHTDSDGTHEWSYYQCNSVRIDHNGEFNYILMEQQTRNVIIQLNIASSVEELSFPELRIDRIN